MKLARLLDDRLHNSLKYLRTQKVPIKTAFLIKGIQKRIEEELIKYEEIRKELILRYAEKDEEGNLILVDDNATLEGDNRDNFLEELNDLIDVEIDVGSFAIEDLGDKIDLSVEDVEGLEGILDAN
jgi:hypothetical protein